MDEENDPTFQKTQQTAEEESVQSGRYGPQYSDSDGDLPDEEDEESKPQLHVPNMWDSWGVLKNYAPTSPEDIELNSLHSYDSLQRVADTVTPLRPRLDSFDILDSNRKFQHREESEIEEDDASLRTYQTDGSRSQKLIQVAQGPVDEDMHRAWETHLEDICDSELETLAGWYGDAPKVLISFYSPSPHFLTGDFTSYSDSYEGRFRYD